MRPRTRRSSTRTSVAPAYVCTLVSASCAIRYSASAGSPSSATDASIDAASRPSKRCRLDARAARAQSRDRGGSAPTGAGPRRSAASGRCPARGRAERNAGPNDRQRSDPRIHDDVRERLSRSHLDASDVSFELHDGHVTPSGAVSDRPVKHDIESLVDGCDGVRDVDDRFKAMRTLPDPGVSDAPPPRRRGPRVRTPARGPARRARRCPARPRRRRATRCPGRAGSRRSTSPRRS